MQNPATAFVLSLLALSLISWAASEAPPPEMPPFVIGIMDVDLKINDGQSTVARDLSGIGITHVHRYSHGKEITPSALKEYREYLDVAHQHDLGVMFHLYGKRWVAKDQIGVKAMRHLAVAMKDHPALDLWSLFDEPNNNRSKRYTPLADKTRLQPFYEMLKKESPHIPVSLTLSTSDNWKNYGAVADVQQIDAYPIRKEGQGRKKNDNNNWRLLDSAQWTKKLVDRGKPTHAILQAFQHADGTRPPTSNELRHMIYASLVHGVEGIWFFSHARQKDLKAPHHNWTSDVFNPLVKELHGFMKALEFTNRPYQLSTDDKILAAVWLRGKRSFLAVINNSDEHGTIKVEVPHIEGVRLVACAGTREASFELKQPKSTNDVTLAKPPKEIALTRREYKVIAKPFEVFVYELLPEVQRTPSTASREGNEETTEASE